MCDDIAPTVQVFSAREVHKSLRVVPEPAAESAETSAATWQPRWCTSGRLQLTQALYRLDYRLDGQPITCQLLPNQDGSFAMSVRGQAWLPAALLQTVSSSLLQHFLR